MLTPEQRSQISRQMEAYQAQKGSSIVKIPFGEQSFALQVDSLVANPDIMNSGIQVVEFLKQHPDRVKDKVVVDMGTGSGIIGVAAGLLEAKSVLMADIDEKAVQNALANINKFKLANCQAFQSDLFSNFPPDLKADLQIFNHPFFADEPPKDKEWARMMLGGTELLGQYFKQAPLYSKLDARYILPWLTLADSENKIDNDPGKRAPDYGYEIISVTEQTPVAQGLQKSAFKIYELKYHKEN